MKTKKQIYSKITLLLSLLLVVTIGCERALSEDVVLATYSPSPDVYIDGFSSGLEYYPYLNSKVSKLFLWTRKKNTKEALRCVLMYL